MVKILIICMMLLMLTGCTREADELIISAEKTPFQVSEIHREKIKKEQPVEVAEEIIEPIAEEIDARTFRVTAYCPCEICCGEWGENRPIDDNGEPIVIGAGGSQLSSWYSVASPLPFGTQVELNGIGTVEVQDRTANWLVNEYGENIIDIYMSNHNDAKQFGVQYIEGVIKWG